MDVGFIGRVGGDGYGHFQINLLSREGVDVTHFRADTGGPARGSARPPPRKTPFSLKTAAFIISPPGYDTTGLATGDSSPHQPLTRHRRQLRREGYGG